MSRFASRIPSLLPVIAAALCFATGDTIAAVNPAARYHTLSPVDCVGPSNMVVQYEPAPHNVTYMRVQHMGDPGTAELEGQVANTVTWNVGELTGLAAPTGAQRGYRDEGWPVATSAFQVWCNQAGFFINTAQFSHAQPLVGQGPNVSVARDFDPWLPAFRERASILVEASISAPWSRSQATPFGAGTAQVGFFIYYYDRTTGTVITQGAAVFDNRPPGVNGSGVEGLGHDGVNAFVSSPLAQVDGLGRAVRFVTATPFTPQMHYVQPWGERERFRVVITHANFAAALAQLRQDALPNISPEPSDYLILSFGLGGEVIPGTDNEHNVELGASVADMTLSEIPARPLVSRRFDAQSGLRAQP